ncbi:hypothetical protein EYF80_009157 [Liparis tanakae]|uniref:Uncharacterized protein n=1 Tax=Liparis tanakae TaxID=230148 RepID=A0A4Z2IRL9_9TELE|nr:hypothetical protein EYF80_009157 [Liparis tanakae]
MEAEKLNPLDQISEHLYAHKAAEKELTANHQQLQGQCHDSGNNVAMVTPMDDKRTVALSTLLIMG